MRSRGPAAPAFWLLSLVLSALFAAAQEGTAAGSEDLELEDRILAVVDEDPILASDVERAIAFGLAGVSEEAAEIPEDDPEEAEALRRRALAALIAQRLRFHEIERFGFTELPLETLDAELAAIRGRFPDPATFRARLGELGLDEQTLRQLVLHQLMVLTYVEERLGPRVFVDLAAIQGHYRTEVVPPLERAGAPVPPLDEVREQIRVVLRERRLNQEIEAWTRELRAKADVQVFLDSSREPLPPVVGRIGGTTEE